ncbi:class I SAM-dependent RNA methyltransferase [Lysobacter korlensis]|uniref:Class I SAM-dependent RNA methyltransferase n=1 Tax=Lysobacter korlensis TaxID=553636 RepID=A0ABV6RYH4_9GAMM
MGENVGREIELAIDKVAHGGVTVARHEGRVVFVGDAIPGERVIARVTDDRKNAFWRADTVRVLDPSPHRREHVWAAAGLDVDPEFRPGGAEFGHIRLAHQRKLKADVLAESMERMAGIEARVEVEALPLRDAATDGRASGEPVQDENGTGWRTRVRLHVDDTGRLGPYAARSHRVIRVRELPLATPELAAAAPLDEHFPGEEHVDLVAPSTGEPRLIVGTQSPTEITERVGEREFRLDDSGFWQVHVSAARTLTDAVRHALDLRLLDLDADNLDLYGGVGLLAAAVADRAGADDMLITSVESSPRATEHARHNLREWPGATAETGRVERWLRSRLAAAGPAERQRMREATVVLDPPRAGAGREVIDSLAEFGPAQLIYVACDPVALARDTGLLAEKGYELRTLRAFDLFPNTHHLEAVASFVRRG